MLPAPLRGDRCGWLKDPFGYSWTVATFKRELSKEEIQRGAEQFCAKLGK